MNGKYEVTAVTFSLETMCALKVAQQVLSAMDLGHLWKLRSEDVKTLEEDAVSRTQTLELPREMMKKVEGFIHPMMVELRSWDDWTNTLCTKERPIFKSCGRVDTVRSVNAILLNKKIDKRSRYMLACKSCREDILSEIHESVHPELRHDMCVVEGRKLATFWQKAFSGVFGKLVDGRYLPQNAYDSGLALALNVGNDDAVKYFINKVSPETARERIYRNIYCGMKECIHFKPYWSRRYYGWCKFRCSPTTYYMLFSKMSEDQQGHWMFKYAFLILASSLEWPYQQFFLEAVNVFGHHLWEEDYWVIMRVIIAKIRHRAGDYNYYQLFVKFWQLRLGLRHLFTSIDPGFGWSVFDILMIEDESLISFMFKEMTNEEKDRLLMEFDINMICTNLISENRFHQLQLFIRGCCMNRINVLQEFKSEFLSSPSVQTENCDAGLQHFVDIVDGIARENRNLDAMEK